ncbi:MAG: DUF1552 domain-containing protein [Polyangiaceae bacterium]|nr:DUF1552 domain-containing protein [Polyangiaceae bacterium]
MSKFKLSRRFFLRGAGGVAIALPLLDVMSPRTSRAAEGPKRYLVCFGGQSLGADNDTRHNLYVPDATGPLTAPFKLALAPLEGVKDRITVVSNLEIPAATGGTPPAAGRPSGFHATSLGPLFSGMRSSDNRAHSITSDQVVANAVGQETTFASLVYRVQAGWYLADSQPVGRDLMSYRGDGDPIDATVSPKQAFDSLFYNFATPDDPAASAEQDFKWRARKSVLDLVERRSERLVSKLSGADRQRLEKHWDEIRDLEMRISALPPVASGACEVPTDPGADPAQGGDNQSADVYDTNVGYSGEEQRATVFCDLVQMAFACDLTRASTLMFTMAQSHMMMNELTGDATDQHELGHGGAPGGTEAVSRGIAWHMKHFGRLVQMLADTPENGGSLLDSCAVVFLHEGGHGFGENEDNTSHSTENMACLVAGGAGGLVSGVHIDAGGLHPANVLITAMNAVGVDTNQLGEVTGTVPGLRG